MKHNSTDYATRFITLWRKQIQFIPNNSIPIIAYVCSKQIEVLLPRELVSQSRHFYFLFSFFNEVCLFFVWPLASVVTSLSSEQQDPGLKLCSVNGIFSSKLFHFGLGVSVATYCP